MTRQLRCSFCGKKDSEVAKLVAGPRVFICDGCVAIASQIMNDPSAGNHPPSAHSSVWRKFVTHIQRFINVGRTLRVGPPIASR